MHYSKEAGSFINFIVVICSIVIPFLTLTKATVIHSRRILSETLLGFISIICGSGFSGLVCFLTAYGLDRMDRSMSWYRNTLLAPGIYSTATLLSLIFVYDVIDATLGVKNLPLSLGLKVQARLDGVNVFWGVITLGVTVIGLRAGSIFMIMLLTTLICNIIIFCLGLHNSGEFLLSFRSMLFIKRLCIYSSSLVIRSSRWTILYCFVDIIFVPHYN